MDRSKFPEYPKEIYCKQSSLSGVGILPTVLMKTKTTPKEGYTKYILATELTALQAENERLRKALVDVEEVATKLADKDIFILMRLAGRELAALIRDIAREALKPQGDGG